MIDANPILPAPGQSACFPLPVLAASGAPPELHGLLLSASGRLAVASYGSGFAVQLEPEDCSELALLLWALAGRMAAERAAAAERAGDALQAISASFNGGAR